MKKIAQLFNDPMPDAPNNQVNLKAKVPSFLGEIPDFDKVDSTPQSSPSNTVLNTEPPSSYQQSSPVIRTMQTKMIGLSQEILSHPIQSTEDRELDEGDTLAGASPFMNFLATQMNGAKTKGKQVVDVSLKQPLRSQTAQDPLNNFKAVLKSIQHIGSGDGDTRPDGVWGERTTNALKNLYALGFILTKVYQQIFKTNAPYGNANLSELLRALNAPSLKDKIALAPVITRNLEKLEEMYDTFRANILDNPRFRDQITQTTPLLKLPSSEPPVDSELLGKDKELYDRHEHVSIPLTLHGVSLSITPGDLLNSANFIEFLKKHSNELQIPSSDLKKMEKGVAAPLNRWAFDVSQAFKEGPPQ